MFYHESEDRLKEAAVTSESGEILKVSVERGYYCQIEVLQPINKTAQRQEIVFKQGKEGFREAQDFAKAIIDFNPQNNLENKTCSLSVFQGEGEVMFVFENTTQNPDLHSKIWLPDTYKNAGICIACDRFASDIKKAAQKTAENILATL